MELIKINDQKLKIMLTPSDMTHYHLNAEHPEESGDEARASFRLFLEEVRQRIDFDFDDRSLSIRYFPSREGGCEMFLCCTPQAKAEPQECGRALPVATRFGRSSNGGFSRDGAYRFDSLDGLLRVCERLLGIQYIGESDAFRDDCGFYYLLFQTLSPSPFTLPEELSFLTEYGKTENAAILRIYFREHGSLICKGNAVELLGALR